MHVGGDVCGRLTLTAVLWVVLWCCGTSRWARTQPSGRQRALSQEAHFDSTCTERAAPTLLAELAWRFGWYWRRCWC